MNERIAIGLPGIESLLQGIDDLAPVFQDTVYSQRDA
jgi:hypothetical protein